MCRDRINLGLLRSNYKGGGVEANCHIGHTPTVGDKEGGAPHGGDMPHELRGAEDVSPMREHLLTPPAGSGEGPGPAFPFRSWPQAADPIAGNGAGHHYRPQLTSRHATIHPGIASGQHIYAHPPLEMPLPPLLAISLSLCP